MENRTTESAIWVQYRIVRITVVVAMVKELTNGTIGFNSEEIKKILAYVKTS